MKSKDYDFFAPGIRGYLQHTGYDEYGRSDSFNLEQEVPNLDISYFERNDTYDCKYLEPTTASRMLYVFGLLLEEDENRYNKKILSLNDTQDIDRIKKLINPKWVDNNKVIFEQNEKFEQKYFWKNIKKNFSKLTNKIYTGKSKFIKDKMEISLKYFQKKLKDLNTCYLEYGTHNQDFFVYIQWYNKKERQCLIYLIKNDFFVTYLKKMNFHYYYKTGMLYKENEYPEQIKALEIIRKSYFDNTPFSIEEFNKTYQNSRVIYPFIVDLNREDFLQKTLWGRIQYFFRSKIDDRYYNQAHLESYMSKRYFGV